MVPASACTLVVAAIATAVTVMVTAVIADTLAEGARRTFRSGIKLALC
jgi:hypothetical protein